MRNNLLILIPDKKEQDVLLKRFQNEYNIYFSSGASEALQVVEKNSIHLIISVADLPVQNGWVFCAKLKAEVDFSHIPFILITADDSIQTKIKNLDAGADAYLTRPFSLLVLEAQVRNLLANREKITAHFTGAHAGIMSNTDFGSEESFIRRLHVQIGNNLHNCSFNVELLARLMNMSRPAFYRKIKGVTDCTPNDLINGARLERASELLRSSDHKVNEIARMTGFFSQSSFAKTFIKSFKVTPTEYRRLNRKSSFTNPTKMPADQFKKIGAAMYAY